MPNLRMGVALSLALVLIPAAAAAQQAPAGAAKGCEEFFRLPGLVWRGTSGSMTLEQFAAYAAPVFWLSPDEPTLQRSSGRAMRMPAAFPFEAQPDGPVVYYQFTLVANLPGSRESGVQLDPDQKGRSVLNLDVVSALHIKYIAYFPQEAGVGGHLHDVEPTEFRILVGRANGELARELGYVCDQPDYVAVVTRVTGEAHGNPWYYNVLEIDAETVLPLHVLVEEGKHAAATDKNADGYFTPGYDVTRRTNDAWGVRDTIRGGTLFSAKYEAWMAKVRRPEHRVLPPLPVDSPLHGGLERHGVSDNAVYELRPYPSSALATDPQLRRKIAEKETKQWPVERADNGFAPVREVLLEGRELKPFSVAYRYDGEPGIGVAFPLLIVKNVPEPLSGGYLVNRMYFKDDLHDWGWMVMYTPSASRWFDQYLAAGMDTDRFDNADGTRGLVRKFVLEGGFKLRFRAPNRVFGFLTDFWGFRAGVKSLGAMDIDNLSFVLELGAGVW